MNFARVLKRGSNAKLIAILLSAIVAAVGAKTAAQPLAVKPGEGNKLNYERDERGNRIPDFSNCGYAGADRPIPDVPVAIVVTPAVGDDGPRIQAAIDRVSKLPLGDNGLRGAVMLAPGKFEVDGQLRIAASGVVLRGAGAAVNSTTIVATSHDRRALVRIEGAANRKPLEETPRQVVDEYIPIGAKQLRLDSVADLHVGQQVIVTRPSTLEWIKSLGMDAFGIAWKPGSRDVRWDRVITAIDGDTITIDAPITTAIEQRFGGAIVGPYEWSERIENVGVEDLQLVSEFDKSRPFDEDHAWFGVTIQNVQNAWVRRVEFKHFAGGAVALWENTKWVTVDDCISLEPISELAGYRRNTYFTQGQLTLFLRCWSEHGQHDFSAGHCAPGPNAFVNCYAANAQAESGPVESWASGVLYDNVRIDGAGLNLQNRWITPPGAGWSAANCVLWQCQAAAMHVDRPPNADNWAIGVWAGFSGDGTFQARSDFVKPISLYQGQLRERRGEAAAAHVAAGLVDPVGSTNPTIPEAAKFSEDSRRSAVQLIDIIRAQQRKPSQSAPQGRPSAQDSLFSSDDSVGRRENRLQLQNGWLTINRRLLSGGLQQQGFWRGTIRPDEAAQFGPAITRFVPGRVGTGFTDELAEAADNMLTANVAVFDHHYGLWYDRRRDDHTMVRQQDANVAPPFYEQPFARTGIGTAWDGLSEYDLTKLNPWYWRRLRDFAHLCDELGLVLFHQNYFQHNILEAGAHWADCPWRPANNVNDTGLPEPPPYIGDKRIFMAANFYDVSKGRLRALHRGYIRQCLDNFADCSNVVQMTGAEYSGPLEFTQFWLDTIIGWQREHKRDVLVALSAPKNVQDAILADPQRSPHVDIIDIRYWCYTADGSLYAPEGGRNLAPRQHLRQTRQKHGGFAAIAKAVREYRTRYPDKAVTYYADMHCPSMRDGWAVLVGGGSLPNLKMPDELARAIPQMRPVADLGSARDVWCLADEEDNYLIHSQAPHTIFTDVRIKPGDYRARWIAAKSGAIVADDRVRLPIQRWKSKSSVVWLARDRSR
jgi:hypothetical protein